METILVTGVAGFIGSKVAEALISNGYTVIGVDNLSSGEIDAVPNGVLFINEDTFSDTLVKKLEVFTFIAVFHIAGQSSAEVSFLDPIYDLKSNVESSLLLLEFCRKNNIKKFIFTSSATVYGHQDIPFLIDENAFPKPISFYAIGKFSSEQYFELYAREYGITVTVLRLFNVYGPGQNLKNLSQGMVSIFVAQALKDKNILVKGSPERFRDFIFIDDVVKIFLMCLKENHDGYNLFNICSGIKITVFDLIQAIKLNLPFEVTVEYKGMTKGDIFGQTGSNLKMLKHFKIDSLTCFDKGIKEMLAWAKGNV